MGLCQGKEDYFFAYFIRAILGSDEWHRSEAAEECS